MYFEKLLSKSNFRRVFKVFKTKTVLNTPMFYFTLVEQYFFNNAFWTVLRKCGKIWMK